MATDSTNTAPAADGIRAIVNEVCDVRYWTLRFGVSEEQAKSAVNAVAMMLEDVLRRLRN